MPNDPNVLLLTADDLSYDSPSCMGNKMPDVTPNLDDLAAGGYLFTHGYSTYPICGPARDSISTGLYPQRHGQIGHGDVPPEWWKREFGGPEATGLATWLGEHGYLTGQAYKEGGIDDGWHVEGLPTAAGKSPGLLADAADEIVSTARDRDQPFFANINVGDPHRFWAGAPNETENWMRGMVEPSDELDRHPNGKFWPDPPRTYDADEITVPPQYPDDPLVRERLKHYYDTVTRMDESIGRTLSVLEDHSVKDETVIVFIADHGLGWAYSKYSLYPGGVRTPFIVRWPGEIQAGRVDDRNVVSGVDVMPTLLDLLGLSEPHSTDGRSLRPLMTGETDELDRTGTLSTFDFLHVASPQSALGEGERETYIRDLPLRTRQYRPMRALHTDRYCYVWNAWATGSYPTLPRNMGGNTFPMKIFDYHALEETEDQPDEIYPAYGERAGFYRRRTPEELYDIRADPGCLDNLVDDPEQQDALDRFREQMRGRLTSIDDHELANYEAFLEDR